MITGDKAYSPDNIRDIKAITNDDNSRGEKIKVVLISKAGSEGLDFKNIRQVHILEPWYNTNRIEQIIGRAVRTCSHKLLPLKNRNVSVFLHGSYFKEDKDIEPVDMYIYRKAEQKSIQIGRVTRLLKEGSIDCNLNIAQQNFTAETFNHSIKQELFDKQQINIYLGDKKFTEACDYMDTCLYKCIPQASVETENLDTYNSYHIKIKQDVLKEKIKLLFREHYALNINDLIKLINIKKTYSKLHITNALNYLINNKDEILIDKYNRPGHLISAGNYFIFQPNNMINKKLDMNTKISLPDYTRRKINIVLNKTKETDEVTSVKIIDTLEKFIKNYNIVLDLKTIKSSKDWYKMAGDVIHYLTEKEYNITILLKGVIHHQIETLQYIEKKALLNYLYTLDKLSEYEQLILEYFKKQIMTSKSFEYIYLFNSDNEFLINNDNIWIKATPIQLVQIYDSFKPHIDNLKKHLANLIEYYSAIKSNEMLFKIKDRQNVKNKGARSDQLSKKQLIDYLNIFTKENTFTKDNTKSIVTNKLSVYLELIIRYKELTKPSTDSLFYMLTPEEAHSIHF